MIKIEDLDCTSDTDCSMKTPLSDKTDKLGRYECEDCHETFAVKRELATHQRIHSGEQPHSCTQCGKEFGTRQLLKKHWMWHTGERSHVCPHCNKAFFQKGHLTQHLMIHSGGRPHECPQCHKTFIFKFDLNRHMKIHQERGFSCLQCGRSFMKQTMLDEHHLKCKGKPSSPIRSLLTPTMRAGLENSFSMKPSPETLILTPETIAKMAQKLLIQQQQENAFGTLLVKQENILNNNNNNNQSMDKNVVFGASSNVKFEIPAPPVLPPLSLTCMICNSSFNSQNAFTLHMYMYHISPPALSVDSTLLSSQSEPSSDVDPSTDTSCSSSPQKASPLTLESASCLEQSSVSPSSSSGASPQPTVSESSTTSSSCKDCLGSWRRVHDLEQQVVKKDEEFENYRQMTRQLVTNVSNFLSSTASPDNLFMLNVFTQLKNTL
uniref:C2H2-type domain-containing protein n=1 Tax=Caenorhabditis japonica TaxID=281687 RepID=A0A8R1HX05_CAEJA